MIKKYLIHYIIISILFITPVLGTDFNKAVEAYQK